MRLRSRPVRAFALAAVVGLGVPLVATLGTSGASAGVKAATDDPKFLPYSNGRNLMRAPENEGRAFQAARDAYYADRIYSGPRALSVEQVAKLHDKAAAEAAALGRRRGTTSSTTTANVVAPTSPIASGPSWANIGPSHTVQLGRTTGNPENVSGRISAMAIDHAGNLYAGAAGGGLWKYDQQAGTWSSLTDSLPTLAVGAVAIDPADDNTIYLGTGEADLSGDSHFGDGIWKSIDGGVHWTHVGSTGNGNYMFDSASISRLLAVRNAGKLTLYVATIRGRGGSRRVSPPTNQVWGIYRSDNGGGSWTLLKGTTSASHGATDLEVDPNNPTTLYASFWGDKMYKSNNAKQTLWHPIMNGLPGNALWAASGTRFAISATKVPGAATRLYAGFDYYDNKGRYHPSRLWRSDDAGESWAPLPTTGENGPIDSVSSYCGSQCSYDNVVEADPSNADIVYAGGMYNYGLASGGIYRSVNGGTTWQSLGWDLHPDFHALAVDPSDPAHIAIGNDGGVWQSPDRGGRPDSGGDISGVDWQDLNSGLTITQFTSIDYSDPTHPNRFWGGTQDNGTQRKSSFSNTWFDLPGGDGGQVLVDHNDTSSTNWAFGEYYGISPYRFQDGSCCFGDIAGISTGIDTSDRSEFYVPWLMNQGNGNQLFYGTFRVYRTDNAETTNPGDVRWHAISGDLTSGCTGPAPNGGRNCTITALGHSEGANALWVGTQEGYVWVAPDAGTSGHPHWVRVDTNGPGGALANRPVTSFAVDRSNWRIAYVSYAGYDAADPTHPGHVFRTTDGGASWTDVTGDLPEGPVNSVVLNPSNGKLMAGTDFGAFVADVSGSSPTWTPVGSALPAVQVWQLAYDSSRGLLVAGTHGRGAWTLDTGTVAPAFVASTADSGVPEGPGKQIDYSITVKNEGNADATGVTITQPVPGHTTFTSAADGGVFDAGAGTVSWTQDIPAGSSVTVHYSATIDPNLSGDVADIVSDGLTVGDGTVSTTGSPFDTPIAPAHAVDLSTASPTDGAKPGASVTYPVTITNPAYNNDSYTLSTSSANGWTMTLLLSDCSTPLSGAVSVASGDSATVCVKVDIPASGVSETAPDSESVTATSVGDGSVSNALALSSIPVTTTALVVDGDGNAPDVQSYYTSALTSAGVSYAVWDLSQSKALGLQYLSAHRDAYWFTGSGYPGPVSPYETLLTGYLNGGGHLFLSGIDILDQAAGTSTFVHDYLHIAWDGSEAQNDKATSTVTGEPGSAIGNGLPATSLVRISGLCSCEDEVTPVSPAQVQFRDDGVAAGGTPQPDGIAVDTGTYKVVFLAFPFEEYGAAADRVTLATRVNSYFGS